MGAKEKILSQRERLVLWTPILAFLLVIAMEFSPFYQVQFSETDYEISDEERTLTVDIYDDYYTDYSSAEDRYGSNESIPL